MVQTHTTVGGSPIFGDSTIAAYTIDSVRQLELRPASTKKPRGTEPRGARSTGVQEPRAVNGWNPEFAAGSDRGQGEIRVDHPLTGRTSTIQ